MRVWYPIPPLCLDTNTLETVFGYTYTHPTTSFNGRHGPFETGADLGDGATDLDHTIRIDLQVRPHLDLSRGTGP